MEASSMIEDDVRAAAERLVQFHERFAPLFGREQAQGHAYTYVKGLMVCPERKSIEPIALNVGDGQVSALLLSRFAQFEGFMTTVCMRSRPSQEEGERKAEYQVAGYVIGHGWSPRPALQDPDFHHILTSELKECGRDGCFR
jgi:hypothetical protein